MNKKGKLAMEILAMMILVVVTSAILLTLIQSGIISVKADNGDARVLNAEFIPLGREGYLVIKEVYFCGFVENFQCIEPKKDFNKGEDVYVLFQVEGSTYHGDVYLVRNYQLKDPDGEVILMLNEENNYYFEMESDKDKEEIAFADYFTTSNGYKSGEYTLDIVVGNPLLSKELTLTETFMVK